MSNVINMLDSKSYTYRKTFENVHGRKVLADLAKFCRADRSCFHENARIHGVLEGRREVWLRIQKYLNLTPEEIAALRSEELNERSFTDE